MYVTPSLSKGTYSIERLFEFNFDEISNLKKIRGVLEVLQIN